ncbi:LysR family transcriptional regulator [Vibrio sp. MarTm2]|uniref:LysR family transcriptional regulator n=1 Tax=Vibrio sp. MarTm2 TaxID=2998831 RepID=UPI0022CDA402|nr:LysR family transcriptional regulator [Vibrio sp. MarTm2]MDA0129362.1 LysR family transcriptional regulator [Vibrio sp. MarTm2]
MAKQSSQWRLIYPLLEAARYLSMRISFNQIEAFVSVAETGSFSSAAKKLNKDRSTLSQMIANFEIDLGYDLFDREGRYPSLTEEGLSLYEYAKRLHTEATYFEGVTERVFDGVEEEIKIAVSGLIPTHWLTQTMTVLRTRYPKVKVHWSQSTTEVVKQQVLEGEVDLAIVIVNTGEGHISIKSTLLANLDICAVKAVVSDVPAHADVNRLSQYRQIMTKDLSHISKKRLYSISREIQYVDCMHLLLSLVMSGEGWAFLPKQLVQPLLDSKQLELIEIKEAKVNTTIKVSAWTLPNIAHTPVQNMLLDTLQDIVSKS